MPALSNAPAVVDQRIDLAGKTSPVAFEFTLERFRLVGNATDFVRGAIVSEKVVISTTDDITVDVTQSSVDVKEITLTGKAGGPPVRASLPGVRSLSQFRMARGTRVDAVIALRNE